jgi:hypothetical protein
MDIIILMCWRIRKERNEWILQGIDPIIVATCGERFLRELTICLSIEFVKALLNS